MKGRDLLDVAVGIAAIVAVIASIRSCSISGTARDLASEANKIAKSSLELNRPYIILSPERNDAGEFYSAKITKDGVSLVVGIKMENKGSVPAKDISLPEKAVLGADLQSSPKVSLSLPSKVTLGPGDHMYLMLEGSWAISGEQSKKNMVEEVSKPEMYYRVAFGVRYASEVNQSWEYVTFVDYGIRRKDVTVLKSEMTTRDKRSPEYWAEEAYAHQLEKDFEQSIEDYRKAIAINPQFTGALVNLGWMLHDIGRTKEAHEYFDKALQIKPDLCEALTGKAALLLIERDGKGAVEFLKRCQEEKKNSPKVQYALACAYSIQGRKQEAIGNLERAIGGDQSLKTLARRDSYFSAMQADPDFKWLTE
jgi:tetratricopeptide (TPR) repeat protein